MFPSPPPAGSPQANPRRLPTQAMRPGSMPNLQVTSAHSRQRPERGSDSQVSATPVKDPNRMSARNPDRLIQGQRVVENGPRAVGCNTVVFERASRASVANEEECGRSQAPLGPGWVQSEHTVDAALAQQPLRSYAASFDEVDLGRGQHVASPNAPPHGSGRVRGADGSARRVVRSSSFSTAGRRTSPGRSRSPHY